MNTIRIEACAEKCCSIFELQVKRVVKEYKQSNIGFGIVSGMLIKGPLSLLVFTLPVCMKL